MKAREHPLILLLIATCSSIASAQRVTDHNNNLWISHWGDHRFSERWSFHTEFHFRQAEMGAMPQQLLLRPAINFHLNADVMFTEGYSYYYNYRYGTYPIKAETWEHHLFEQMQINTHLGRVSLQHRFRMEHRFIAVQEADPSAESGYSFDHYSYQSRFRIRLWATLPLGPRTKVEPQSWFAAAYDELFLNFGDSYQLDYMHQNRISGLLGYQFNAQGNVMAGYLLQTVQRPGAADGADLVEMNNTLHVVLVYNLDFRKPALVEPSR